MQAKTSLRSIRQEFMQILNQTSKTISKDDFKRFEKMIQKNTDDFTEMVRDVGAKKEKELSE